MKRAGHTDGSSGARGAHLRWRWAVYVCLLAAGGAALAARAWPSDHEQPTRVLLGRTGQGKSISVSVRPGERVQALATQLVGLCENGSTWKIRWSPADGAIRFRPAGREVTVRETQTRSYPDGTVGRIVASTSARLGGSGARASGDARMVASFSHPGRRTLVCDSGYVHWSAAEGDRAEHRRAARPGEDWYYPAVPSLAGPISPARRAFAALVDQACVTSDNRMQALEAWARARYAGTSDAAKRANAAHLIGHAQQVAAILRLGMPPDGRRLYARWLRNVRERLVLDRRGFREWARHARRAQARTVARMNFLKLRADVLGQEFGLRVCSSNGPFHDPVPVPRTPAGALPSGSSQS